MVNWDSAVKQSNRISYWIGNKGQGKKVSHTISPSRLLSGVYLKGRKVEERDEMLKYSDPWSVHVYHSTDAVILSPGKKAFHRKYKTYYSWIFMDHLWCNAITCL